MTYGTRVFGILVTIFLKFLNGQPLERSPICNQKLQSYPQWKLHIEGRTRRTKRNDSLIGLMCCGSAWSASAGHFTRRLRLCTRISLVMSCVQTLRSLIWQDGIGAFQQEFPDECGRYRYSRSNVSSRESRETQEWSFSQYVRHTHRKYVDAVGTTTQDLADRRHSSVQTRPVNMLQNVTGRQRGRFWYSSFSPKINHSLRMRAASSSISRNSGGVGGEDDWKCSCCRKSDSQKDLKRKTEKYSTQGSNARECSFVKRD